jgi:leader peptidase (prepilin peptidase) / N-methyltransferase
MISTVTFGLLHIAIGVGGVWLSLIDAREHRLPNLGTATLAVVVGALGLVGAPSEVLLQALACAGGSAGALAVLAALPPRALGWGDVKLQVSLGFYLGIFSPTLVVVQLAGSFVIGGVVAIVLVLGRKMAPADFLAFGPWMVMATVLATLLGKYAEII